MYYGRTETEAECCHNYNNNKKGYLKWNWLLKVLKRILHWKISRFFAVTDIAITHISSMYKPRMYDKLKFIIMSQLTFSIRQRK